MLKSLRTALRLLLGGNLGVLAGRLRYRWRLARVRAGKRVVYRRAAAHFLMDPAHPASVAAYLDELEDRRELKLWRAWLQEGDCAIDGGAHAGLYAFAGAPRLHPGRMLAVEADAGLARMLVDASAALSLQATVDVAPCAISNLSGEAEFFFSSDADRQVLQSLKSPGSGFVARKVPLQTLAQLADRHFAGQIPAAVKLDLEGAEALALAAAPAEWFEADGPLWLLELNAAALARFGATPADVLDRFAEHAYVLHLFAHYPSARLSALGPAREFQNWDAAVYFNLVAVPLAQTHSARRTAILRLLP